jgi:serine/threonine protein kinase
MSDHTVKLLDFGLADVYDDERFGQTIVHDDMNGGGLRGNAFYCAPEVLTRIGGYATTTDVWSLGICLYRVSHTFSHSLRSSCYLGCILLPLYIMSLL